MYPIAESSRFINSHAKYGLFAAVSRAFELANCGGMPLSKSGLTSAPRRPQPAQTKRGSIPERRTSSGQRSALRVQSDMMAAMAIDEDAAQAHLPHLAEVILTGRPSTCVGVWRRAGRGMPPSKRRAGQSQIINPLGLGTRASYCASWGLRSRAHAVGAELERARFAWRFFLLPFLGVASCRSCFSGRSHRVATAPPDGGNRAAQRCSNLR